MGLNVDPRVRTAMVSDSLDAVGVRNNVMNSSVRALRPGMRAVGIAATVRFEPASDYDQKDPYGAAIDYLDTLKPGEIKNSSEINQKCNQKNNIIHIKNEIVNGNIVCVNNLYFKDVIINGNLNVKGDFIGSNFKVENFLIIGNASFSGKTKIMGSFEIVGELKADDSQFLNKIIINSRIVSLLNGSGAKDIQFVKSRENVTEEYLYIDNSVVNGNVVFESGKGHVVLKNGGKLVGKVIGGNVVNNAIHSKKTLDSPSI